jgi:hypothetical protein
MCGIKEKAFNDSPKSDANLQPFSKLNKISVTKIKKKGLKKNK